MDRLSEFALLCLLLSGFVMAFQRLNPSAALASMLLLLAPFAMLLVGIGRAIRASGGSERAHVPEKPR